MNARKFFESQSITIKTDISDLLYKTKFSRSDLWKFAEAYHKFKLETLNQKKCTE